jgi:hypothetical protein
VNVWIAYAIGVATLPALWLWWHIAAILVFTVRDTYRSMCGEIRDCFVALDWGVAIGVTFLVMPFLGVYRFTEHLICQIEARVAGYETEVLRQ